MNICRLLGHKKILVLKGMKYPEHYTCLWCGENRNYKGDFSKTAWTEFWDEYGSLIAVIFWTFVGILVTMGTVVAIVNWGNHRTCDAYSLMGIDVSYNFWTNCMANHPVFGWVPISDYFRIINLYTP